MSAAILVASPALPPFSEARVEPPEVPPPPPPRARSRSWARCKGWFRRRIEDRIVWYAGVLMAAVNGTLGWHSLRRQV